MAAIRVRGIYATALTARLREAGHAITDPSDVLRERVDGPFANEAPDLWVRQTADRAGVEVSGTHDPVPIAERIARISDDAFVRTDGLPRAGVYRADVADTAHGGAVVETGAGEAFLPYGKVDAYVENGDRLLVQVIDPGAPWIADRRPVVAGEIRVAGTGCALVRGADARFVSAPSDGICRAVDLLDPDVPDGWGIALAARAEEMDPSILAGALADARSAAETIDKAVRGRAVDAPAPIATPITTAWCRFGRAARFTLDADRDEVTPTVDGHHRLKAIGRCPGRAVDFLEGLDVDLPAFDAHATFEAFGPSVGDSIAIHHGKPGAETIVLGEGKVTARDEDVRVRRSLSGGGTYDGLGGPTEKGDRAETTFVEGQWWYPTIYRGSDGTYKGTYVNVGTPLEILPDRVQYIDLYIDVIRTRAGAVEVVDREELRAAVDDGAVPPSTGERAEAVADAVAAAF